MQGLVGSVDLQDWAREKEVMLPLCTVSKMTLRVILS